MARSARSENSQTPNRLHKGRAESSPRGLASRSKATTESVTVVLAPGLCACGCGEQVARRFRPGHDARLKGQLVRAARSATRVKVVPESGRPKSLPAVEAAALLDTAKTSWSAYVERLSK
jgi:hypothetical protein